MISLSDSDQAETASQHQQARLSKRRSRSGVSKSGGRESPIGAEREREFPTTKVGAGGVGEQAGMGNNDGREERQYGGYHGAHSGHGRCSGAHGLVQTPTVQPRGVITGDLVQSRDFHYTVEPAPVYRRPREVVSQVRGRTDSRSDYAYVEHKNSPYHSGHSGSVRTSVRGLPEDGVGARVRSGAGGAGGAGGSEEGLRAGRLDQNYMMVRAQSRLQDGYDRLSHRSDSRGDLLDSDHAGLYEHGLYYQPGQYSGFVRTCDGKFIRTNIPQHDFETLDTNFYRNSSAALHTMRRPGKSRHSNHGNTDYCCPSREENSANIRASDQLQQSYATLRGRKYTEKTCGRGVGDNYGRNTLAPNFMEDARSVHSLADDFFLPPTGGSRGHHLTQQSQAHTKSLSRSTDKSLDSLGLEDQDEMVQNFAGLASLANLRSDEILATMLKREPPDGKEKPEPPKHQKLEANSRKNSKCDLLDIRSAAGETSGGGETKTDSAPAKRDSSANNIKENSAYLDSNIITEEEIIVSERLKDWKPPPGSPRCPPSHPALVPSSSLSVAPPPPGPPCSSPKPGGPVSSVRPRQASLTSQMAARALNTSQYSEPSTSLSPLCHDTPSLPLQIKTYFRRKITRFFGVDSTNEDQARTTWVERRRRLAIKKLGGVKEEEYLSGFGVENTSYGYVEGAGYTTRSRLAETHQPSITSELEGDKMVLKILKPPRDKDSLLSLCWQCCSWAVSQSLAGTPPWQHPLVCDHLVSRSYLPSAAGQAAYYQAETCGGLAVCQPLTRISNHHHAQGENPAEEVGSQSRNK